MNKIKAARICCFTLGTALLLSALFLVIHNVTEDRESGEKAASVLAEVKRETREYAEPEQPMLPASHNDLFAGNDSNEIPEMETITLDDKMYIGYISIPAIGIELPVLEHWSYPNLKTAPCRYAGSIYTDDIIICAHNYTTHFGKISNLHAGDQIIFTEVNGKAHHYSIISTEQIPGTAAEDMQADNDWDLTLFTCTLGGQSRITVRAVRMTSNTT